MAAIDAAAQERFGLPDIVLMEEAGGGIFSTLTKKVWGDTLPRGPVVFLAGRGNNGGDALVVARLCHLAGMDKLHVILGAGEPGSDSLAGIHLKVIRSLGIEVVAYGGAKGRPTSGDSDGGGKPTASDGRVQQAANRRIRRLLAEAEWLVDGLLGTGLNGELRSPLNELIRRCNDSPARRVAVDMPSGIGDSYKKGYPAFAADFTLTVELPKLCLYLPHARRFCGHIHLVSGVFPRELIQDEGFQGYLIEPSLKQELLKPLDPDTHKGGRGHLAVFAGSTGTTGAAWLSATSAARCRAGLVTAFMDSELYTSNISKYSSVMLRPWDGELPGLSRFDALLVGPGWGLEESRERILAELLAARIPGVLDADGITLLARLLKEKTVKLGGRWVLTPHPGELSRLLGMETAELLDDPLPHLLRCSADLQAVVVLKGHCSFVAGPRGACGVLDGMNPSLATGGSGDVLAGICAGLLTSGCSPENAAALAVLIHAEIGEQLHEQRGYFLAEDMIPAVSSACCP
jgi:NAD(P)H-hydrate epimerase